MPYCIVKKTSAKESALLTVNGKTVAFQTKLDAKKFLANQGVYCLVGYSFPEIELTPEEIDPVLEAEVPNVEQEPVA
jgi:hypothetical protein